MDSPFNTPPPLPDTSATTQVSTPPLRTPAAYPPGDTPVTETPHGGVPAAPGTLVVPRERARSRSRERIEPDGRTSRVRPYVFTLHNLTDDRLAVIEEVLNEERFEYVIVGRETCPTTQREHLQGYFKLKNAATWVNVKRLFGDELNDIHLERAKGSPSQNYEYCSKEKNIFMEKGDRPKGQGNRSDLDDAIAVVTERGLTALATEMPRQFVLHHRGFAALEQRLITKRTEPPQVYVLWGPTGTGKSYWARKLTDDPFVWHPQLGTWFDGYCGQEHAIFEEFRGQIPFGMVLSLLDRYDCRVQVKGGSTEFRCRKIFFTSPAPPEEWFQTLASNDGQVNQLKRRITRVIHLTTPLDVDAPLDPQFNALVNL